MKIFQKLKTKLQYVPTILPLGIYPKQFRISERHNARVQRNTWLSVFKEQNLLIALHPSLSEMISLINGRIGLFVKEKIIELADFELLVGHVDCFRRKTQILHESTCP